VIYYRYGKRLDNIDYESMGYADVWCFRSAVILLTCFEMESKKYYERADFASVYSRLFNRYNDYISNMVDAINIDDGLDDKRRAEYEYYCGGRVVNEHAASFAREDAISYFKTNNLLKINIPLFEQYLHGNAPEIYDELNSEEVITQQLTNSLVGTQVEVDSNVDNASMLSNITNNNVPQNNEQYRFEKTTQSWNIRFGKLELIGVKDLVGMGYIATLLKNPGESIGVIQIQAMLNPLCVGSSGGNQHTEFEDQDGQSDTTNDKSTRSSKSISLENLKKRLEALALERNMIDPDYDHIELEAIENECAKIEAEIDNILYSRNDDPEIKKNRDKVAKAIKAAIENIRGLKTKDGYSCTPICNFLTQHIKTASECIYNPPTINPPDWSF